MRAHHILLPLTATLVHALPGGGWDGSGHHGQDDDPKHYGYQSNGDYGADCDSSYPAQPAYTKHEVSYTKPEPVYTKPKDYPNPTPTFTCPTSCRLIYHGTFLAYPTVIEYTSVYAETVNAYVTEYADGSPDEMSEETMTAAPAPTAAPLTWTYSGVTLTYPTTYVAYFSIAYATTIANTAQSTCMSTQAPLQYPRVWPSLIADSTSIRQPGDIPPATVVEYIDSLPTVREQLGGNICDPVFGGLQPFTPTATVTSATTIAGNTRIVQTTTVSAQSVASTTTAMAPPPPPPPPPPPSSAPAPPAPTPSPPPVVTTATTRGPVIQTVNAAVVNRHVGVGTWLGNALAAMLVLW